MTPALYLTRNGLLEPLGKSQVFGYLKGLSINYKITLITYEKIADLSDKTQVDGLHQACKQLGIRWLPQCFVPRPMIIAPALSMIRMIWLVLFEVRTQGVKIIHARSYIPAVVSLIVGRLTGVPFIFDMRALWPEELITAGRLKRGSLLYRLIIIFERACLRRAGAVVSLTHAAVQHITQLYPAEMSRQTVAVIPTCADLERFVPATQAPEKIIIGCLGTVKSGWFRLDWLATFLAVVAERNTNVFFEITTRDDPVFVRNAIGGGANLQSRLSIGPCPSDEVHKIIQRHTASVMFFTQGLGKLGSSPTRMAEILGSGLPVVANYGVGDVAVIIQKYRVGVLVSGPTATDMANAFDALQNLLADPELALRCRRAAEEVFSLGAGTGAYAALYQKVLTDEASKQREISV